MAAVLEKTSRGSSISPAWAKRLALIPRYDSVATAAPGQYFDEKAANRAVSFIEECCQHIEGKFAGKPFVLEPWQKGVVGCLFGWKKPDGSRRYREAFVLVGRGNGKALALDTPIPTPDGWKNMGDIVAGDVVFDDCGLPTKVLEAHPVRHNRPCFRVVFSDKTSIVADEEHLWAVIDRKLHGKRRIIDTKEMSETYAMSRKRGWTEHRYSIPVAGALHCDAAKLLRPSCRPMSMSRQVVCVEPVNSVPVRCIRVDSPSSLFLAGEGMVPTHNTPLAAAILCYLLFADGERGAQIYGAAGEREQASLLYRYVRGMVEAEPQLNSRAQVFKGAGQRAIMLRDDPAAGYKVLSSDGETKHGFVPHGVISDELHVWGPLGKPLMEAIETAFAKLARRQPLHLMITTSDFRRDSVCNDKHDYARMVRDGKADDPSFLPVLYELDDGDDWQDESVWHKANPNLGVTVDTEALRREFTKAKEQPSYENSFKRLHLNIRTESDVRWLPMDRWHACPPLDVDALKGKRCWGGLDLASTRDITALVLAFRLDDGTVALLPRFWVPRDVMADKSRHRDRQHYQGWIDKGYIQTTPTSGKTDYDYIRADINALRKLYKIQEIAYDPWNAEQVAGQLDKDGASMVKVAQGKAQLTAGAKEFEALVATSQIRHGSNPVLDWMAGNVSVESDAAGNIRPAKDKSLGKIDGIVAAVMAVGRLIVSVKANTVYAERGLVVL